MCVFSSRICKEHGFSDHVWNLALMGSNQDKLDAAKYFESSDKPQYENAVILYEKVQRKGGNDRGNDGSCSATLILFLPPQAGFFAKALDLAIATNQHGALLSISKKIENTTDPILATRWVNYKKERQSTVHLTKKRIRTTTYNLHHSVQGCGLLPGEQAVRKGGGAVHRLSPVQEGA